MRFEWVEKLLNHKDKISKMTDIGSNLGYMCIKFNEKFGVKCLGYEYEKPTYNKAKKIINNKSNIKYLNRGLKISTIKFLDKTDLIVHLNVLHHAGHMYDKKLINNSKDWVKYSTRYLKILSKNQNIYCFKLEM